MEWLQRSACHGWIAQLSVHDACMRACVPQEERAAWELADPEDRPKVLPQAFPNLRSVPAYARFIHERFERCLDLYLCPRVRRKRCERSERAAFIFFTCIPCSFPRPLSWRGAW